MFKLQFMSSENLLFMFISFIVQLMEINKYKNKTKQSKDPGNETPCHSTFSGGIICGPHRGSFAVQFGEHLRSGNRLRRCTPPLTLISELHKDDVRVIKRYRQIRQKAGVHYQESVTSMISQGNDIFTDQSFFRYFPCEIGQFQST